MYDKNGDTNITPDELIIVFLIAGNEDAFTGPTSDPGVWAHESCTKPANTPFLDNVHLMGCNIQGNYAVFGERHRLRNYDVDATIGIIAHELGHAVQDQQDYLPLKFRSILVPAVNISSNLGWILIIIGLFLRIIDIAWLGVFAFSAGLVFSLITLPVEFNASARAKEMLTQSGIITTPEEREGVNKVLNAAALTYVAAVFSAAMQLLYWVSVVGGMGGRRRR